MVFIIWKGQVRMVLPWKDLTMVWSTMSRFLREKSLQGRTFEEPLLQSIFEYACIMPIPSHRLALQNFVLARVEFSVDNEIQEAATMIHSKTVQAHLKASNTGGRLVDFYIRRQAYEYSGTRHRPVSMLVQEGLLSWSEGGVSINQFANEIMTEVQAFRRHPEVCCTVSCARSILVLRNALSIMDPIFAAQQGQTDAPYNDVLALQTKMVTFYSRASQMERRRRYQNLGFGVPPPPARGVPLGQEIILPERGGQVEIVARATDRTHLEQYEAPWNPEDTTLEYADEMVDLSDDE